MSRESNGNAKSAAAELKPLQLLDLPVDVLTEIVKRINHTNDLACLALTHSALHGVVIPQMYSRFDIIWPDDRSTDESNSGVDALTFGLATLVMGEELFNGEWPDARAERGSHALSPCPTCSTTRWHQNQRQGEQSVWYPGSGGNRWRKGNHYARYTRKFSISNGPEHMVSDYLITKDSGKMLGTLVALAIARMPMLESFIWDMRTGVLRDVWLALSSLGDRPSEGNCRLKHIWLRCHDNSLVPVARRPVSTISTPGRMQASAPAQTLASTGPTRSRASIDRPSFSILPPLESLSVVDIDELAYLDEMSMLIERSQPRLRELRVGIAFEARDRDWAMSLTGDDLVQVDNSVTWQNSNAAGSRRLAGPLGVLVSRIYDINDKRSCLGLATANPPIETHAKTDSLSNGSPMIGVGDTAIAPSSLEVPGTAASQPPAHTATEGSTAHGYQAAQIPQPSFAENPNDIGLATLGQEFELAKIHNGNAATQGVTHGSTETQSKVANTALLRVRSLRLDLLELERVPLFIPVMLRAFDWRFLTSLTILNCPNHERLWGSLRRACRPIHSVVARASSSLKINSESAPSSHMLDYPLKLKKLWTNTVSSALMTFLRDTLAPDSLEVLFLQEAYDYKSEVTIDSICRGPIKRHRRSLKKLLIDSVERSRAGPVIGGRRWRRWMLSDEHLAFVLNSKMSSLRELSIALDGKDWHVFLQRLPSISHLRSLYISSITSPFRTRFGVSESKEMALQVLDIITLRPEMELCYLAIGQNCFEIVEGRYDKMAHHRTDTGSGTNPSSSDSTPTLSSDEDGDLQDGDDNNGDGAGTVNPGDVNEVESDGSSTQPTLEGLVESWISEVESPLVLRLREILFYDDKVAIFKARHGHL